MPTARAELSVDLNADLGEGFGIWDLGDRIGAQVGYRDLAGFGRRFIDATAEDLTADVMYQIGALQALAHAAGSTVTYVKPHGALYNTIVRHAEQADAVATAVHFVDPALPVLGL